jgi:hypothetical protein
MEILSNISPLPFYTSISGQHHRKSYAFGQVYPLITPINKILPFQIFARGAYASSDSARTSTSVTDGASFNKSFNFSFATPRAIRGGIELYDYETDSVIAALPLTLEINQANDMYSVRYLGKETFPEVKEGRFYLAINVGGQTLYSEVFTAVADTSCYLKLKYSNSHPFNFAEGAIDFSNDFFFECYLDTQIGKPEYTFEEEATTRMGYTFIESQVSKKTYRFVALAPEYLCDALRIVRLCNNKVIEAEGRVYRALTFSINPTWEEQGDLASIECEFEIDSVISNIGNLK